MRRYYVAADHAPRVLILTMDILCWNHPISDRTLEKLEHDYVKITAILLFESQRSKIERKKTTDFTLFFRVFRECSNQQRKVPNSLHNGHTWPVQGVPLPLPEESWDKLQQIPVILNRSKRIWIMDGWMDGCITSIAPQYYWINLFSRTFEIAKW